MTAERSIPAWAGEARQARPKSKANKVDPRVGGGSSPAATLVTLATGRSPRGRGKQFFESLDHGGLGSIPAWAGEAPDTDHCPGYPAVDPRVGGGSELGWDAITQKMGRSPRGRGKRCRHTSPRPRPRSIPAWAGEARRCFMVLPHLWVDPRVGGGSAEFIAGQQRDQGRSPRGRGKLNWYRHQQLQHGSIPAWAGEAIRAKPVCDISKVDPRVGGGSTFRRLVRRTDLGRSPRGRGKRGEKLHRAGIVGSIPAWAGEAGQHALYRHQPEVDPRVGGGSTHQIVITSPSAGRSPRGRGKLCSFCRYSSFNRSIPAWAGEACLARH